MDMTGKRVLVTRSTTGIGQGAAAMFRAAGARVAINGRDPGLVDRVIAEMGGEGYVAAPGHVGTVESCRRIVDTAVAKLGGLDCLVNNVGIGPLARLMHVTEPHWNEVIAVNLRAALFSTQAALPALRASRGSVVPVSSVTGLIAGPQDSFVYAISKGGLIGPQPQSRDRARTRWCSRQLPVPRIHRHSDDSGRERTHRRTAQRGDQQVHATRAYRDRARMRVLDPLLRLGRWALHHRRGAVEHWRLLRQRKLGDERTGFGAGTDHRRPGRLTYGSSCMGAATRVSRARGSWSPTAQAVSVGASQGRSTSSAQRLRSTASSAAKVDAALREARRQLAPHGLRPGSWRILQI